MKDDRPIGVFDSGVGGLTVLQAVQNLLPLESTIYFGDLARCPYGTRPQSEVREFASQVADFLASLEIKILVIACNTATAAAYTQLRERLPFPVVGVIEPGSREAVRVSASGVIGVVATDGTVASGAYRRSISRVAPHALVYEHAASWLVPLVEAGVTGGPALEARLRTDLEDLRDRGADTLILGCTHFPLIRDLFETVMGPAVSIVPSAEACAREVGWVVRQLDIGADGPVEHRILITGQAGAFAERTQKMFHDSPTIETVDILATSLELRSAAAEPA